MNAKDLIAWVEEIAPLESAEKWDHVGWMIEPENTDVTRVLLSLDATPDTAREAQALGAQLVITHHPLFFHPLERLTADTFEGRTALAFARRGIGLYSAHTNLDASVSGTWAALLELLGVENARPLADFPCGGMGEMTPPVPAAEMAERLTRVLGSERILSVGPMPDKVRFVAAATGAGADAIDAAQAEGVQLLITGEMKYHEALPASFGKVWILEAGHYETERPVLQKLITYLQFRADRVQSKVEFFLSQVQEAPEKALKPGMEG